MARPASHQPTAGPGHGRHWKHEQEDAGDIGTSGLDHSLQKHSDLVSRDAVSRWVGHREFGDIVGLEAELGDEQLRGLLRGVGNPLLDELSDGDQRHCGDDEEAESRHRVRSGCAGCGGPSDAVALADHRVDDGRISQLLRSVPTVTRTTVVNGSVFSSHTRSSSSSDDTTLLSAARRTSRTPNSLLVRCSGSSPRRASRRDESSTTPSLARMGAAEGWDRRPSASTLATNSSNANGFGR